MTDKQTDKLAKVTAKDGTLSVEGDIFGSTQGVQWRVEPLADGTFVLQTEAAQKTMRGNVPAGDAGDSSIARCSQEVFADFMYGLSRRRWSGAVSCDVGQGIKRVYFDRGEIVFAASNMMDDRLGEVIYRDGMITLDELTDSAVKVDRNSKFGQVLLSNGTFTNVDLWLALKRQVQDIVYSIFISPSIYVELHAGRNLAPTHVVFDMGTERLLDEAIGFGLMARDFISRLDDTTQILPGYNPEAATIAPKGTFAGDLLDLLNSGSGRLDEVVKASKLTHSNTLIALMGLSSQGLCDVEFKRKEAHNSDPQLAPIKSKMDLYSLILREVKSAFAADGRPFPVREVQTFAWSVGGGWVSPIFLDEEGEISAGSHMAMYAQCQNNPHRVRHFEIRLESLLQFLLQLAGDNLSTERSRGIRRHYREITV